MIILYERRTLKGYNFQCRQACCLSQVPFGSAAGAGWVGQSAALHLITLKN